MNTNENNALNEILAEMDADGSFDKPKRRYHSTRRANCVDCDSRTGWTRDFPTNTWTCNCCGRVENAR